MRCRDSACGGCAKKAEGRMPDCGHSAFLCSFTNDPGLCHRPGSPQTLRFDAGNHGAPVGGRAARAAARAIQRPRINIACRVLHILGCHVNRAAHDRRRRVAAKARATATDFWVLAEIIQRCHARRSQVYRHRLRQQSHLCGSLGIAMIAGLKACLHIHIRWSIAQQCPYVATNISSPRQLPKSL